MAPGVGGYRQINKALNICAFEEYLESQQTRLPKILDVEQISPRVVRVLGQNPGKFTLQGTNTYIVGTGAKRLIIDTAQGIPDWAEIISETLADGDYSLSHVLLTHWHGDHTGGVPDLISLYPDLTDAIYKHTPSRTQKPIVDGQVFRVEGPPCEEQAMFTGDNILGHGTAAVEHLSTWMETMRLMQSHNCVKGFPAHGIVIEDLKAKINGELAGKLRREQQALQALQKANSSKIGGGKSKLTVKELVTAVYGGQMATGVRELALEPFMDEVLRKLAEDGKVGFDMRGGVKKVVCRRVND
ncbi:hypothetical protein PG995_004686 [Apiospora arundinis]